MAADLPDVAGADPDYHVRRALLTHVSTSQPQGAEGDGAPANAPAAGAAPVPLPSFGDVPLALAALTSLPDAPAVQQLVSGLLAQHDEALARGGGGGGTSLARFAVLQRALLLGVHTLSLRALEALAAAATPTHALQGAAQAQQVQQWQRLAPLALLRTVSAWHCASGVTQRVTSVHDRDALAGAPHSDQRFLGGPGVLWCAQAEEAPGLSSHAEAQGAVQAARQLADTLQAALDGRAVKSVVPSAHTADFALLGGGGAQPGGDPKQRAQVSEGRGESQGASWLPPLLSLNRTHAALFFHPQALLQQACVAGQQAAGAASGPEGGGGGGGVAAGVKVLEHALKLSKQHPQAPSPWELRLHFVCAAVQAAAAITPEVSTRKCGTCGAHLWAPVDTWPRTLPTPDAQLKQALVSQWQHLLNDPPPASLAAPGQQQPPGEAAPLLLSTLSHVLWSQAPATSASHLSLLLALLTACLPPSSPAASATPASSPAQRLAKLADLLDKAGGALKGLALRPVLTPLLRNAVSVAALPGGGHLLPPPPALRLPPPSHPAAHLQLGPGGGSSGSHAAPPGQAPLLNPRLVLPPGGAESASAPVIDALAGDPELPSLVAEAQAAVYRYCTLATVSATGKLLKALQVRGGGRGGWSGVRANGVKGASTSHSRAHHCCCCCCCCRPSLPWRRCRPRRPAGVPAARVAAGTWVRRTRRPPGRPPRPRAGRRSSRPRCSPRCRSALPTFASCARAPATALRPPPPPPPLSSSWTPARGRRCGTRAWTRCRAASLGPGSSSPCWGAPASSRSAPP